MQGYHRSLVVDNFYVHVDIILCLKSSVISQGLSHCYGRIAERPLTRQ